MTLCTLEQSLEFLATSPSKHEGIDSSEHKKAAKMMAANSACTSRTRPLDARHCSLKKVKQGGIATTQLASFSEHAGVLIRDLGSICIQSIANTSRLRNDLERVRDRLVH